MSGFLCTDTVFWFLERLGDPILRVCWFVRRPDDPILRVCWFIWCPNDPILRVVWFVWRPDDSILRVFWCIESLCERSWRLYRLEDPSGGSDLQRYLSDYLHVMIGPSGRPSLQDSVEFFIQLFSLDSPSDPTWSSSYLTIFLRFIVRLLPRNVYCWSCREIYNPVE